jgi:nicotinamidase-related amidase
LCSIPARSRWWQYASGSRDHGLGWGLKARGGFERLVRAWGIEQLVFTGISTNSCVEGTARDALRDASCTNFARLLGWVASSAQVLAELQAARPA